VLLLPLHAVNLFNIHGGALKGFLVEIAGIKFNFLSASFEKCKFLSVPRLSNVCCCNFKYLRVCKGIFEKDCSFRSFQRTF
jgi:hypothetical protein